MLLPILFAVSYLLGCFGVASMAENKKIGSQRTFHISVLFTPLIALLVAVLSTKKEEIQSEFLHCKRCGFEFSETHVSCPACRKEGINVLVNETIKQQVSLK